MLASHVAVRKVPFASPAPVKPSPWCRLLNCLRRDAHLYR